MKKIKNLKKIKIEIITTIGCSKCVTSKNIILKILKENKNIEYTEINLMDNPDIATKYNIMSAPAIIINGKLEFEGSVDEKKLRKKLEEYS